MGFIAPNVWMVNEYGRGLRRKLKRTRRLDRWIDFKSFQVFDEAITYTALQFFRGSEQDRIRCVFSPRGRQEIASLNWREVTAAVFYKDLPDTDSWVFMPNEERNLIYNLAKRCLTLDSDSLTKHIFQGLITSADYVYHLERISPNRYLHKPKGTKEPFEIEIEDGIMKPLVSGPEAKRYQVPNTSTYILFPYEVINDKVHLLSANEMERRFPKAWMHLKRYEKELRARERGKFDDDQWYRFGRHQNIDKQEITKLCVAQTVPGMRVCFDSKGTFYFNNVRVNGIIPKDIETGWFLLGILNTLVCDYVFKRIAKPKAGGYYEANKQFIAPLPIPCATDEEKTQVADYAKQLQDLHSRRRDLILMIEKRLESAQCENDYREENWLWADVKPITEIKKDAPPELKGKELNNWAKSQRELKLTDHLEIINTMLRPGIMLSVVNEFGELKLLAEGVPLIEGIFLPEGEAAFIAAQWRQKARLTNVTEKFDAKRLVNLLLKLRETDNQAIRDQVIQIDADIQKIEKQITQAESDMNSLSYQLYKLADQEIGLVEGERSVQA
jgi:hypothetical protein